MNYLYKPLFILALYITINHNVFAQEHSIARQWNELLLESIRNDFARPTVHARNLFHISAAMYDAWAAIDGGAVPYFLEQERGGYVFDFEGFDTGNLDIEAAQREAISYAAYRLILHRFRFAPGVQKIYSEANLFFEELGYDPEMLSSDYTSGSPAALGNYIAESVIAYGLQDGANESNRYQNTFYFPSNNAFSPEGYGNPTIFDFNRWQPLSLSRNIDQAGNEILGEINDFLSPEWGAVVPFALQEDDLTVYERDGFDYNVYFDPGPPPLYEEEVEEGEINNYVWGMVMVPIWSAQLDPADSIRIDISPNSIGNNPPLPTNFDDFRDFYNFFDGGDASRGHEINPITGQAYEENIVLKGDFGRVLAEFWADGPDSETPPGHWFTIMNGVMDHDLFQRKFEGQGEELDALEYDIKAYLTLGGAMHDAAVTAWGIKGWYDYIRPIAAIRGMAELGQSTDTTLSNYHPGGLPLIEGYIEIITEEDRNPPYIETFEIIRRGQERIPIEGQLKIRSWVGPEYVRDTENDVGGVQWIPAGEWWPYQRPTFVTPPFAGYVSGHSTFSRAAAEVLTRLTGDPFFPGGIGEFVAEKNEFLVFEDGPSEDVVLQWATYRDASDQTSLSRIWGGIHPPADDIPGRIIGEQIGNNAFLMARTMFNTSPVASVNIQDLESVDCYPNPVSKGNDLTIELTEDIREANIILTDLQGLRVFSDRYSSPPSVIKINTANIPQGSYIINIVTESFSAVAKTVVLSK